MPRGLLLAAASAAALFAAAPARAGEPPLQVVVGLEAPPLVSAIRSSRALSLSAKRRRVDVTTPTSESYLRELASAQRATEARITGAIPGARVRWRYRVLVNGLAVVLPANRVARLASLPGVALVYANVRYRSRLDRGPRLIGAPDLWGGPSLPTAGNGTKIAIVDDGVDQSHPFFSPRGFTAPAGYPKGDTAYTSAKVIVARAFPPPTPKWRHAAKPFDPEHSEHATHVAGIAAGNPTTVGGRGTLSGVAPRAYLGNYKVLTIPTASGVGLDGNAAEIAAGLEAAVRDGMDVVNLSIGEPEIEPSRDLVVRAIDGVVAAGVVVVAAAGNDFGEFGRGSIGSPGSAAKAITVAAATKARDIAGFSSSGPTPLSLQLKPEVTAPGAQILSSIPERHGTWAEFSGTSMAAPHVAGAVALLRQRQPAWTPAQIKAALVLTADPLPDTSPTTREGGGLVNVVRANDPRLFAEPSTVSFGLLTPGQTVRRTIELTDAGGGAGAWSLAVAPEPGDARNVAVSTTAGSVTVPGRVEIAATAQPDAARADVTGSLVLSRDGETRRIPFWGRVVTRRLAKPQRVLTRPGVYAGNTAGRPARVTTYLYPETAPHAQRSLAGPEQVFRVRIPRPVANFGVAVLSRARGVRVEPRIVVAGDENRQVGYTSLPFNLNPYLAEFQDAVLVSGAVRPAPGAYDVVFDTPSAAAAGRYTFRFWIDDTAPPRIRLVRRVVRAGAALRVVVADTGSGVDPTTVRVAVDGRARTARLRRGVVTVPTGGLARGRHRVSVKASDYQETRNMENVPRILPNTRSATLAFTVR